MLDREMEERFNHLQENYGPVEEIKYFDYLNTRSDDVLFENAELILPIPNKGTEYMISVITRIFPSMESVQTHIKLAKDTANEYMETGLSSVSETLNTYADDVAFIFKQKEASVLESCLSDVLYSKVPKITNEKVISLFVKPIMEAAKYPEQDNTVKALKEFYGEENLQRGNKDILIAIFPGIINYIRRLFIGELAKRKELREKFDRERIARNNPNEPVGYTNEVCAEISGAIRQMLNAPTSLISCICAGNPSKTELIVLKKVVSTEMDFFSDEVSIKFAYNNPEGSDSVPWVIKQYIENLGNGRSIIAFKLQDTKAIINDNVMEMQPQTGSEIDEQVSESLNELLLESSFEDSGEETVILVEDMEYFNLIQEGDILKFALAEENITNEELVSLFENMMMSCMTYTSLKESGIVTKASQSVEKGARKVRHTFKKINKNAGKSTAAIGKAVSSIDDEFNNTVDKLKAMDKDDRREKIIKGGYRSKLKRLLRVGATSGGAALLNPWLGAIVLLGQIGVDKATDHKVKREIVSDMETNLSILDEKIEDSKSSDDKQAKYQLMRKRKALERELNRIKFNLRADVRDPELVKAEQ